MGDLTAPADLNSSAGLEPILLEHAYRGARLQILLRAVLVVFFILTLAIVPPRHNQLGCWLVVAVYTVWVGNIAQQVLRGTRGPVKFALLDLCVDLAALAGLSVLSGSSALETWTADVLINGFFIVPLLAAAQLRPRIGALVVGPTVAVYLGSSIATMTENQEPWGSVALRTLVLAGLGAGCIVLSYIQRSRMATIGELVHDRNDLLDELTTIEARERRDLAESLHDGALQYVLAARHDLEEARELADPAAFARLDLALTESSRLLRSTVSELHPAVLESAGLAQALRDLASNAEASCGCSIELDLDGWSDELRAPADRLLYATARELVTNVVKHSHAETARISLAREGEHARLVIADDGSGIPEGAVERSLAQGHIGLASHRVRVEAAGGSLTLSPAQPSGTVAQVDVPYPVALADAASQR